MGEREREREREEERERETEEGEGGRRRVHGTNGQFINEANLF